jgi:hypothetical protein
MSSDKINIPSISSLHNEKNIKEKARNDMFTIVLNKCIEKIIYTNRHTDKTFVIFEVPRVLIGYPLYDMKSCIIFLMQKLVNNNYYIEFIEPFYLYIDWGSSHFKNKVKKERDNDNEHSKHKSLKFNEDLIRKTLAAPKIEFIYEDLVKNTRKNKKKKKGKK